MFSARDGNRRIVLSLGLVAAIAARSARAATLVIGGGSIVEGSGSMIEDTRRLPAFGSVMVNGPVDVQLKHTGAEKAIVRADDNLAPLIETRVEGGTLYIETRKDSSFRTRNRLSVLVEFKQIEALQLRSSSNVTIDDIKAPIFEGTIKGSGNLKVGRIEADTVAVSISGSGDFEARGRADKVGFVIKGSGDVRAEDLQAKSAAVSISGSGDVRVHATESLQARVSGSGDVRYRGSPQVEKKVAGSGNVRPMR